MHYGFIGLGNLGSKLAARLAENDFAVTGFDTEHSFHRQPRACRGHICREPSGARQCC
jgi:3-hydroxyisobutyrate dehydrogenase-like beta-hydroxyacid dehydrogenase